MIVLAEPKQIAGFAFLKDAALAKQEEADALARFGDEDRRYQATSGMFWPGIRR